MKAHRGQVAPYLAAVLVAVAVLAVMNVGVFLSVRAKNRAMNAGDAAALAVARYQGELLNRIGADNIAHLKAALDDDAAECEEIMLRQRRACFLDPLEGLRLGNEAARRNGIESDGSGGMLRILREHAVTIRTGYAANPELYPPPWENAWEEYATTLETYVGALGGGLVAGPDNVEFADEWQCFPLLSRQFYHAVAGRNWCWFHFNGAWLLDRDSHTMPRPDFSSPQRQDNSEIYSLHLTFRPMPQVLDKTWTNVVMKLTGCSESDIMRSTLITNQLQQWAFYDSRWRDWWEMDPDGAWNFPVVGKIKSEYDVRGCAAVCRIANQAPNLTSGDGERLVKWVAAAKPFGTVENLDGETDKVTALNRFVTPAFTDARLVPIDAVGGKDLATADVEWMDHVRVHLPQYFEAGPRANGCYYCGQLVLWERATFRNEGKNWLKRNAGTCVRPTGSGDWHGGTPHGH